MLKAVVASAIVAYASAFSAPSAFMGGALQTQAASRSCAISMSAADESMSRRAALASILAGAVAVPGIANAAYGGEGKAKGQVKDWQLKNGGVMTDVQSSSMSGTRTSAFGVGVFGNEKASTKLARKPVTDADIETLDSLTSKLMKDSAISKKGYKTSNKIGINPAYGGSSGVFTGAE
mmetsp:Transcript_90239/g.135305  ORF Transcript_90239/g.135305 Transcript_90239/m.135305 type:complete len:178 (+) Transcript_90239:38-571(+)